jgi:hypothetical protein
MIYKSIKKAYGRDIGIQIISPKRSISILKLERIQKRKEDL